MRYIMIKFTDIQNADNKEQNIYYQRKDPKSYPPPTDLHAHVFPIYTGNNRIKWNLRVTKSPTMPDPYKNHGHIYLNWSEAMTAACTTKAKHQHLWYLP